MSLLKTEGLTKRFGGLTAVDNLDLDVQSGQVFGLIGPNGAGKSTVFNLLTGVFKPTRGKIFFDGEDITNLKPHKIAEKGVGRSFQADINLTTYTVLDNVLAACHLMSRTDVFSAIARTRNYRNKQTNTIERALEVIELLGLGKLKGELAQNLPHGLQRILGIAIAIVGKPKLLLLDEPVSGLSHTEAEDVMNLITQLIRAEGNSIILVEHNMKTIMNNCDYVAVIEYGVKIAEGTPTEIVKNQAVIAAYLGVEKNAA